MARASRSPGGGARGAMIYNDGPKAVTLRVMVGGRQRPDSVTLPPKESVTVPATPPGEVTVDADGGTATAPASIAPTFVVRPDSVLVVPE
ncbi:hypothetical protein [Natronomonas marina]|jgi:hypothetical protein|uniref:hypothetical protein n=1 Tax=Natronomonas marina TaxID=2961939 RepID=UPI0020CA05ED|nr:hypothetical protein [Natronomonas marina]